MSDLNHQIDPALLDNPVEGRGTKREARTSSSAALESTRTSTRLAGKSTSSLPAGVQGNKGKGKDGGEPARGEEENLNRLRGGVSYIRSV